MTLSLKNMKNNAYIVTGFRSAVGKAGKGGFRFYRPDDLAADVIKHLMASVPQLDKERVDDVIVGNATPEAEQGLNVGRMISLMGLDTDKVPGMTVNRYCSSGLETIAIATAKIEAGMADCIIAGGVESMSVMAMGGWRIVPNPKVGKANPTWYWGMGLTAEAVAREYKISREDQDAFALRSQLRAAKEGHLAPTRDPLPPTGILRQPQGGRRLLGQDAGDHRGRDARRARLRAVAPRAPTSHDRDSA